MKTFLLSSAAALVYTGIAATPVLAQNGDNTDSRRDTIVVTARKTEENIQDVPVAVTAFTADTTCLKVG